MRMTNWLFRHRARVGRKEFILINLFWLVVVGAIGSLLQEQPLNDSSIYSLNTIVLIPLLFCMFLSCFKLNIARMHYLGSSAWWLLGLPIPIVGLLLYFVLFFFPGVDEDNPFGARD